MAVSVKTRKESDKNFFWRLEDIYESKEAWLQDFDKLKLLSDELASFQGRVADFAKEAIRLYFKALNLASHLQTYARMQRDTDGSNAEHCATFQKASSLIVAFFSAASFLRPELIAMDESRLNALSEAPDMQDYTLFLHDLAREKPHTLTAQEERIMAKAIELSIAPREIYGAFTNVDVRFPDTHDEKGEEIVLTESNYRVLIHSNNRDVRKEAFEKLFGVYKMNSATLGACYNASVNADLFYATLRHFDTCVEAALFENEIPLAVYDSLVDSIHESLPTFADYLRLRKRALNLDTLHLYDLYCPIIDSYDMVLSYQDSYSLILEALAPLGADYISHLEEAQRDGWIDVYPNQGKRTGAYSDSVYGVHPYVLLNHTDTLDGAFTLAHEMGHAMHSFYSIQSQPMPKAEYCIFVAEVASTVNEIIVMRHLLKKHTDKNAQAFLCTHLLEQFRTTVFRQTLFAEFERITHKMAEDGEPLTRDSLSKAYYSLNETYYGDVCHVDRLIENEWLRIPHFYSAFYVYQYATGFSAAVHLANRILTEGEAAAADYKKFLCAGASLPPIEALKLAGVDMSKKEPILSALQTFKDTLETLKGLLEQ